MHGSVALLILTPVLWATGNDAADVEKYRQVVENLGADSFQERTSAARSIMNDPTSATLNALVRFADVQDPEVSRRVLRILDHLIRTTEVGELARFVQTVSLHQMVSTPDHRDAWDQLMTRVRSQAAERIIAFGGKVAEDRLDDGSRIIRVTMYKLQDRSIAAYLKLYPRLHLILSGPGISDHSLQGLGGLSNVEVLDMRFTQVTDIGVRIVAKLPRLRKLYLSRTSVSDETVSAFEELKRLEELFLSDTRITDASVRNLSRLKELKRLSIRGTRISGRSFEDLKTALPNCRIQY